MEILFNDKNILEESILDYIHQLVSIVLENHGLVRDDLEISISFVDNEKIKEMNKFYRDKDQVTDVLSFPQYDELEDIVNDESQIVLGDIVVSLDRVKEQAETYEHSFERELLYLVSHGVLHLLGYDHINEIDKEKMREKEKEIMKTIQVFK